MRCKDFHDMNGPPQQEISRFRIAVNFASRFGWPIASALTLLASLEPLLHLSHLANIIVSNWSWILAMLWNPIFATFNLEITPKLLEPLTLGLLFAASGIANNGAIREHYGFVATEVRMPNLLFAYIFNIVFFLIYSISRALPVIQEAQSNVEFYLLGASVFAFILTVTLSLQKLLLRNIVLTVAYTFVIVALDRIYEPLDKFLS